MITRFAPLYFALIAGLLLGGLTTGCHHRSQPRFAGGDLDCLATFSEIEYPDVCPANCGEPLDGSHLQTGPPPTVTNFSEQEFWSLSLEEAIELTLANNKILDKLGGRVIGAPQGLRTAYDPALLETSPFNSAEAALADFDAQFTGNATLDHSERKFNNFFAAGGTTTPINSNIGNLRAGLSKIYANGSEFNVFSQSDYSRNNAPIPPNRFASAWDTIIRAEVRQPLAQGAGTAVNRIAGPNAVPGNYNGVLIGRIRGDVALTDFEAAVRDLTRDVEVAYWELYFAYRNLDVAVQAREAARLIWDNREKRVAAGLSRPDDEAQTRQQYFEFAQAAINALSGTTPNSGVLGAERELRRLIGLVNHDGQLIRPTTEPTIAPVLFDWDQAQQQALAQRVELRRQKWLLRQRELELFAARKLNRWRVDALASVAARGFGDDLLGNTGIAEGSAVGDLLTGQLDDWGFGVEIRGPLGNRLGHLAIRNAELSVMREQAILREQQKQLLLDLNAAYNEVDRSFNAIGNQFNARTAVIEELESKRKRAVAGDEDVFFLLDAQRRAATIESNFHRSVVDYNLALQNFVYTSGNLLENYNIQLIEGSWTSAAMADAASKDARFRYGAVNTNKMDICPISEGPVDQSTDLMIIYPESTAPGDAPDSAAEGDDVPESADPDGNGPVSDLPEMPEPAMPDSGTDAAGN